MGIFRDALTRHEERLDSINREYAKAVREARDFRPADQADRIQQANEARARAFERSQQTYRSERG